MYAPYNLEYNDVTLSNTRSSAIAPGLRGRGRRLHGLHLRTQGHTLAVWPKSELREALCLCDP